MSATTATTVAARRPAARRVDPVDALRHERATRRGHQNLAHLRTEAYPLYRRSLYPGGRGGGSPPGQRSHLINHTPQVLGGVASGVARSPHYVLARVR